MGKFPRKHAVTVRLSEGEKFRLDHLSQRKLKPVSQIIRDWIDYEYFKAPAEGKSK